MQESKLAFFRTGKGRAVIVGALLLIIIVLAVVLAIVAKNENERDPRFEPYIDPVSGVTIWNIDEEPEFEGDEGPILLGFYQLKDFGFMSAQYQKIIDTVTEYVESNHENAKRISYKKDSFNYEDNDDDEEDEEKEIEFEKSSFEFVVDNKTTYLVHLDTMGSLEDINIEIEKK
jgi:hypothetical protein